MASRPPTDRDGLTLDAGALIAIERRNRRVVAIVERALGRGVPVVVPIGALAQAWRGGRASPITALLEEPGVRVEELTLDVGFAAGELCARSGTSDVIDASVALVARRYGGRVATSDAADLLRLDPRLDVIHV